MRVRVVSGAVVWVALAVLGGCGGGQRGNQVVAASRGAGRAVFTIRWPEGASSRLIPRRAESIAVEIVYTGEVIARKTVEREADKSVVTVGFDDLPIDTVTVRAQAYPDAAGAGVAQAVGEQKLDITEGEAATIALTMGTTIARVAINSVAVPAGKSVQLAATAYDKTGAVVLISPPVWSSSDESRATVTKDGLVTTARSGAGTTVTLTAMDSESGQQGQATIAIAALPRGKTLSAQFNPLTESNTAAATVGDLVLDKGTYSINSDAAEIYDETGAVVARGRLVTQNFQREQWVMTYAVFTYTGSITLSGKCTVLGRGRNPIVFLAQDRFTLTDGATLSVSATTFRDGAGTTEFGHGLVSLGSMGGGSFGGDGGGSTQGAYGSDFDDVQRPHLQGGSRGWAAGGGGGGIYVASVGPLTITNASLTATGGGYVPGGTATSGGSGGGIAVWSGTSLSFTNATIDASGGYGYGYDGVTTMHGGGGGRVVVGSITVPSVRFITVNGAMIGPSYNPKPSGKPGVVTATTFEGF